MKLSVQRSTWLIRSALAVAVVLSIATTAYVVGLRRGLPDEAAIGHIGEMDQATAVFDDRDQLAFSVFTEQRIDTPLSQMSPHLVHAILAVEDQRFYVHAGYDVLRIFGAAAANLRHRRAAQGASTITQQLARLSFLTPEKTLRRKLQELILAKRIERRYTKAQILELYLNKVYFGDGLYGAEAAARGYFAKHAADLSVSEAALLAGLVKSPSSYAPTVSMDRAIARRNLVLQAMLDINAIDRPTWQSARASKAVLHDGLRADEPHGQYFKEQVRRELVDRFGWQRVYQGGLRVFSTIDMPMQIAADAAVADSLKVDRRPAEGDGGATWTGSGRRLLARRSRSRQHLSQWTRPPDRCGQWWAAETSARATSIARSRRIVSPARRSSRSCTRPRSRRDTTPRASSIT